MGEAATAQHLPRNYKATQASLAAAIEAANAHRDLVPGLAELIGDDSIVGMMPPIPAAGGGGSGSSSIVVDAGAVDAVGGGEGGGGGGVGDDAANALDSDAVVGGHPSLPSLEAVSTAASRLINDNPPFVTMSARDSAPQLRLEDPTIIEDGSSKEKTFQRKLVVGGGMKGYRMSRATHCVSSGCYYYEALILGSDESGNGLSAGRGLKRPLQEVDKLGGQNDADLSVENAKKRQSGISMNGHLRIGWSTRLADLQAPVGYNENSYAIRDIMGSRIHKSHREDKWGGVGFGPNDVLGLAICLVDNKTKTTHGTAALTDSASDIGAAETKDAKSQDSKSSDKGNSSSTLSNHIRFFKNGQPMGNDGIGFNNINPGTYYPAISCYGEGRAYLNFGPNFVYPPKGLPSEMDLLPISDLCTPPPIAVEAVERVISSGSKDGKNTFFSKRSDDNILLAFKELVRVEAMARHRAYSEHMDLHKLEISAIRKKHGLPTLDEQQHSHPT
ncbi:hypothetical protein ACHAW5_002370 [Stephanodiscus triporus]|uniref:SPRY domain-containing protein n=1 Tax=Stephanodiscus triporus TaxID=2934178 RepID=A0ABD3PND2_9STRA